MKPDPGFDIEFTNAQRVHIERLSESAILLHVYKQGGELVTLTLAADSPILIKLKGETQL